eukprot:8901056-Pyramimonas_sp.AAC.1
MPPTRIPSDRRMDRGAGGSSGARQVNPVGGCGQSPAVGETRGRLPTGVRSDLGRPRSQSPGTPVLAASDRVARHRGSGRTGILRVGTPV